MCMFKDVEKKVEEYSTSQNKSEETESLHWISPNLKLITKDYDYSRTSSSFSDNQLLNWLFKFSE